MYLSNQVFCCRWFSGTVPKKPVCCSQPGTNSSYLSIGLAGHDWSHHVFWLHCLASCAKHVDTQTFIKVVLSRLIKTEIDFGDVLLWNCTVIFRVNSILFQAYLIKTTYWFHKYGSAVLCLISLVVYVLSDTGTFQAKVIILRWVPLQFFVSITQWARHRKERDKIIWPSKAKHATDVLLPPASH